MAQREKGGRVVFIGNIPYGVSEEQIMDIFGRAGQVVNFRLVYDKETGQPKGFGFLEYTDTDAAASAVRNLNEFDLNGRTLRVDYSNDNRSAGGANNPPADNNRAPPPAHLNMNGGPPPPRPDPAGLPPLPPGVQLPPGVTAFDAISQTISKIPTPNLIDLISQMKGLCNTNPAQASALLNQAPQLAYAIFQAMLLLDLVDANIVNQLVATAPAAAQQAPPPQPPQPQLPAAMPPHVMPPQGYPPQAQPPQGYPPQAQPPQGYPPQGQPPMPPMPQGYPPGYGPAGYAPTPPQQPFYQPPPQQAAPPQQAPPPQDQASLMAQIAAMSREQIYAIAEPSRSQIIALRTQMGQPV